MKKLLIYFLKMFSYSSLIDAMKAKAVKQLKGKPEKDKIILLVLREIKILNLIFKKL